MGGLPATGRSGRFRIVFLGDSITEGHTLPLLLQQALTEAGKPVPLCDNAGVGGDNAAGMRARLERDVLSRKPDLVVLSTAINDAGAHRTLAQYEDDLTAIITRLKQERIPLVLLTSSVITGAGAEVAEYNAKGLGPFNDKIRELAAKHGAVVAEVNKLMTAEVAKGVDPTEADHCHLNFAGYRILARATLDAWGYADVPVPSVEKVAVMPGIVREWKLRPAGEKEQPVDDNAVRNLKVDDTWKTHVLPETDSCGHWWRDEQRQRGIAMLLEPQLGKAPFYVGVATIQSDRDRTACLNTGAGLGAAWLNGEPVYQQAKHGWAPGRDRLPVRLRPGANTLVIQCGQNFFVSITDDDRW